MSTTATDYDSAHPPTHPHTRSPTAPCCGAPHFVPQVLARPRHPKGARGRDSGHNPRAKVPPPCALWPRRAVAYCRAPRQRAGVLVQAPPSPRAGHDPCGRSERQSASSGSARLRRSMRWLPPLPSAFALPQGRWRVCIAAAAAQGEGPPPGLRRRAAEEREAPPHAPRGLRSTRRPKALKKWTCSRAARRAKKFPLSPGANLGGFGLLRNGGKSIFEIMGQTGVFPAIYPNQNGWQHNPLPPPPVREGHTGRGNPPPVQATTQPNPPPLAAHAYPRMERSGPYVVRKGEACKKGPVIKQQMRGGGVILHLFHLLSDLISCPPKCEDKGPQGATGDNRARGRGAHAPPFCDASIGLRSSGGRHRGSTGAHRRSVPCHRPRHSVPPVATQTYL